MKFFCDSVWTLDSMIMVTKKKDRFSLQILLGALILVGLVYACEPPAEPDEVLLVEPGAGCRVGGVPMR